MPEEHSQFDAQKPKFSVRWQPLDPKWIGTLTLRGSYSEAFLAPTLPDLTPAGTEFFFPPGFFHDPKGLTPPGAGTRLLLSGNPLLNPEVAYEWSYGAVYSPKWIRGLTLSADFWHIDLRSIADVPGGDFIIDHEKLFPQDVIRDPTTGAITTVILPTLNLTRTVVEGLDYEAIYILDSIELWSWRFWQVHLYPQWDLPVPVRASDKSRHSPIWALGFVCVSTNFKRLAAAHSSLCQRVLGRPG